MRREHCERKPAGCRFSTGGGLEGAGRTPATGRRVLLGAQKKGDLRKRVVLFLCSGPGRTRNAGAARALRAQTGRTPVSHRRRPERSRHDVDDGKASPPGRAKKGRSAQAGRPFFVLGTREDSKRRCGASTASANRQDAGLAPEAAWKEPARRRRREGESSWAGAQKKGDLRKRVVLFLCSGPGRTRNAGAARALRAQTGRMPV